MVLHGTTFTTFTTFYTGAGNIPGLNAAAVSFFFPNNTPYTYIRLNITALASSAYPYPDMRMIQWYGSIANNTLNIYIMSRL